MDYKFQYTDNESRQAIFDSHQGLYWIAEENILEGNFLVFSDTLPVTQLQSIKNDNKKIKLALAELAELVVTGGVANG